MGFTVGSISRRLGGSNGGITFADLSAGGDRRRRGHTRLDGIGAGTLPRPEFLDLLTSLSLIGGALDLLAGANMLVAGRLVGVGLGRVRLCHIGIPHWRRLHVVGARMDNSHTSCDPALFESKRRYASKKSPPAGGVDGCASDRRRPCPVSEGAASAGHLAAETWFWMQQSDIGPDRNSVS
jgi:hypothetical protein